MRTYGEAECRICGRVFVKKAPVARLCGSARCDRKNRSRLQRIYKKRKDPAYGTRRQKRFSGSEYENPPEKIEAIKRKYADGVPLSVIEDWINGIPSDLRIDL